MATKALSRFSLFKLHLIKTQHRNFGGLVKMPNQSQNISGGSLLSNFKCRFKSTVTVHFKFPDGNVKTCEAKQGSNLLDVVLDHDVDIDGFGACEGTLACSTCHLIVPTEVYEKLAPPVDEELDMLDLAFGLTETSRLGCQVILTKDLDGITVDVPSTILDARG